MKRIFVLCDGTWQSELNRTDTNVMHILRLLKTVGEGGIVQVSLYDAGVGSGEDIASHITGGISGIGLDDIIMNSYTGLADNYEAGDDVFICGFSRGSYVARSLAGLIHKAGLLPRERLDKADDAYSLYRNRDEAVDGPAADQFRRINSSPQITIKALCCFDTVGAMGFPDPYPIWPIGKLVEDANKKYEFYDTNLSRLIEYGLHAVSIDERRKTFMVTPMDRSPNCPDQVVKQVWFSGCHSDVGGGQASTVKLASVALKWMIGEMEALGTSFDQAAVAQIQTDPTIPFPDSASGLPFGMLPKEHRPIVGSPKLFHRSVFERLVKVKDYMPVNVEPAVRAALIEAGNANPVLSVIEVP